MLHDIYIHKESQEALDPGEASREGSEECLHKVPRLHATSAGCSIVEYLGKGNSSLYNICFPPNNFIDPLALVDQNKLSYFFLRTIYRLSFRVVGSVGWSLVPESLMIILSQSQLQPPILPKR